jgi:ABC-2 type transport system permease protein
VSGNAAAAPSAGRALRRLYLTIFLRGRTATRQGKAGAPKSVAERLALTLLTYAVFGLVAFAGIGQPVLVLAALLHGFSFFSLAIFLMTSAGETLFNRDEPDILAHRPVDPAVVLKAKVLVMIQVSLWIVGALNLPGLWLGTLAPDGGWLFPLVHAASTAMLALFTVGVVVLSYELCLRWIGRDRLESLLTSVQVVFSILVVLAAQFGPRVIGRDAAHAMSDVPAWGFLLPPVWFAGLDDALAGSGAPRSWLVGGAAVLVTALVLWLALVRLAGTYKAGLETAVAPAPASNAARVRRRGTPLVERAPLRWWVGSPVARAAFGLTLAYLVRDRETRLRVYPGVVPLVIIPILILMDNREGGSFGAYGLAFAGMYVGLIPMLALDTIRQSSQAPAAAIFRAAPLPGPGPACLGARRAVILVFGAPVLVALVAACLFLDADPRHVLLVLPGLLAAPILTLFPCLNGHALPFSRPIDDAGHLARSLVLIGIVVGSSVVAGVAILFWHRAAFGWFVVAEAAIVGLVRWLMGRAVSAARWAPAA